MTTTSQDVSNQALHNRITKALYSGAFRTTPFCCQNLSRQNIKMMLLNWDKRQEGLQTFVTPINYISLRSANPQNKPDLSGLDLATFEHIPSTEEHWQARDSDGNVLAYRYRLQDPDKALLGALKTAALALPKSTKSAKKDGHRGQYQVHHYACWKAMESQPRLSAEYLSEMPSSDKFINDTKPLFDQLSQDLRMISPDMYVKYTRVQCYLPQGVIPLAGAWHGVAINLGQDNLTLINRHQDWNDKRYGFNCVLPFGDFTGGELILWQLRVVVELLPSDVLLFFGRQLAHNIIEVKTGVRHSIDLFCHEAVFKWVEKQKGEQKKGKKREREEDDNEERQEEEKKEE